MKIKCILPYLFNLKIKCILPYLFNFQMTPKHIFRDLYNLQDFLTIVGQYHHWRQWEGGIFKILNKFKRLLIKSGKSKLHFNCTIHASIINLYRNYMVIAVLS